MTSLKAFWTFWAPAPDALMRLLKIEQALLERQRKSIERKQVLLRVKHAAVTSALEQIELELKA